MTSPDVETGPAAVVEASQPARRRISKPMLVLIIVVLALAAMVAGVNALGGFELRTDAVRVQPGEPMDAGPVTLRFMSASLEPPNQFEPGWKVIAVGTCELTTQDSPRENPLPHISQPDVLLAGVENDKGAFMSELTIFYAYDRDQLSPGIGQVPCQAKFTMPVGYEPTPKIAVIVYRLEWTNARNVQTTANDTGYVWLPTNDVTSVALSLDRS